MGCVRCDFVDVLALGILACLFCCWLHVQHKASGLPCAEFTGDAYCFAVVMGMQRLTLENISLASLMLSRLGRAWGKGIVGIQVGWDMYSYHHMSCWDMATQCRV